MMPWDVDDTKHHAEVTADRVKEWANWMDELDCRPEVDILDKAAELLYDLSQRQEEV